MRIRLAVVGWKRVSLRTRVAVVSLWCVESSEGVRDVEEPNLVRKIRGLLRDVSAVGDTDVSAPTFR